MSKATKRGFPHNCIKCGEENVVRIDLENLGQFTCTSCEAEFDLEEVEALLTQWGRIVQFIRSAPEYTE